MHFTKDAPKAGSFEASFAKTTGVSLYDVSWYLFLGSAPLFLFKQAMNFLQMQMAITAMNKWEENQMKLKKK